MARDNQMMNVLLIAGGGYALYYILNNYGPKGAVYNSSGTAINPSYWQTWFPTSAVAQTTGTGAAAPSNTPVTASVVSNNGQQVTVLISGPPNQPVTASIQGATSSPSVPLGTTNASGALQYTFNLTNSSSMVTVTIGNGTASFMLPIAAQFAVSTLLPAQSLVATIPVPVASSVPVMVSPSGVNIYSAMQAAAASNAFIQQTGGQADAYQWATLWNAQGQPAIDVGSLFTAAQLNPPVLAGPFNPAPAPVSTQGLPLMSLTQFLSTLQSAGIKPAAGSTFGLSGMGAIINLPSFNSGRGGFSGGFRGGFRGKPLVN